MAYKRVRPYPSENRKLTEKKCCTCGRVLPIAAFDWNGRGDWIAKCRKCKQAKAKLYTEKRREMLNAIKEGYGCQCGCGENASPALLFHHRDPSKEVAAVGTMVSSYMWKMLTEIAKCDVMCFNCHAKAHAGLIPFPSRKKDIEAV